MNTKPKKENPKWFGPERNLRRRKRYSSDAAYKESIKESNRRAYRSNHAVILRDCSKNAGKLSGFGAVRTLDPNTVSALTFSCTEMASLLGGYSRVGFYQWLRKGMFPKPTHLVLGTAGAKALYVYTATEATKIISVFSRHQKAKAYFTKKDTTVITSLFEIVN